MWKVPLFNTDFDESETNAALEVIRSGWLTMGETTRLFEERFAEFIGAKYSVAVSNCTAALHLGALALGIGPEDEVICPSFTFVAGANSIRYTGARPVFADIESLDTLCIGPESITRKITKKTKAIQVMHYAGYPCSMDKILDIARHHKLHVIEDCAHAPGAEFNGTKCGILGDVGCFSFFSNKNMTTAEGGMITTNDEDTARKIRLMRSHGMTTLTWDRAQGHAFSYDVIEPGYNYRMDEIRAAIGIVQLEKLATGNRRRRFLMDLYQQKLRDVSWIQMPFLSNTASSSYHICPILLPDNVSRYSFMGYLKEHGIQTSIHYPPIHLFSYYNKEYRKNDALHITEEAALREVTLPLYPSMKEDDVDYVVQTISCFGKEYI